MEQWAKAVVRRQSWHSHATQDRPKHEQENLALSALWLDILPKKYDNMNEEIQCKTIQFDTQLGSSCHAKFRSPQPQNISAFRWMKVFGYYKRFVQEVRTLLVAARIPNVDSYTGHSFGIDAATTTAMASAPKWLIRMMGRWKSDAVLRYIRTDVAAMHSMATRLVSASSTAHIWSSARLTIYWLTRNLSHCLLYHSCWSLWPNGGAAHLWCCSQAHATGSRTQAGSVSPTTKLWVSELLLKGACHILWKWPKLSDNGHSSLPDTRLFNHQRGHGTALSWRRLGLSTAKHTANPQRFTWLNTAQSCSATCACAAPLCPTLSLCPGKIVNKK